MRACRSFACVLVSVLALAFLGSPPARSQVPSRPSGIQPIPAGPFQLYPTFTSRFEVTDNLFRSNDDPLTPARVRARITSVAPGVWAELPYRDGGMNIGYALRYRNYGDADIDSNVSHFFLLNGAWNFSRGFSLTFEEDYRRGVLDALDTEDFEPGAEPTFRNDKFVSSVTNVEISQGSGPRRRVGLTVGRDAIEYDENEASPFLFDSEAYEAEVFIQHQFGYEGRLRLGAYASDADLSRVGEPDNTRKEETLGAVLRGNWRFSPASSLQGTIGLGQFKFFGEDESENTADDQSRNWVGTVTFMRSVPARPVVTITGSQGVFTSVLANNFFYVSRQLLAQVRSPTGTRLDLGARVQLFRNDYPKDPQGRVDDIVRGRLWAGYRFDAGVEWGVYADVERRSSVASFANFDVTRFGTTVILRR